MNLWNNWEIRIFCKTSVRRTCTNNVVSTIVPPCLPPPLPSLHQGPAQECVPLVARAALLPPAASATCNAQLTLISQTVFCWCLNTGTNLKTLWKQESCLIQGAATETIKAGNTPFSAHLWVTTGSLRSRRWGREAWGLGMWTITRKETIPHLSGERVF